MVSLRCKMFVESELELLGFNDFRINLGVVEIDNNVSTAQRIQIRERLATVGLFLLDDEKAVIIETIKNLIIETIHYNNKPVKINFSHFLSLKLRKDYNSLSNLFSETTGTTIEQFIISHKIERAKELLLYDEHNLTEISQLLHYGHVSHLSSQFKKITGLTPTYFRKLKEYRRRIDLDSI